MDRLRFPEGLLFVFPIIKFASVLPLAMGIRWQQMGRLTSAALVLYFVPAVALHARAKDPISKYPAALVMLVWSCAVWRLFSSGNASEVGFSG